MIHLQALACLTGFLNGFWLSSYVLSQINWKRNQTPGNFWENAVLVIFRPKYGYFGAEKNVCPPETSIYILFLTVLLIPVDGQRQVDIFRHRNFVIWSTGTKVMPLLVKNWTKIIIFWFLSSNMTKSSIFSLKLV